MQNNTQFDGFWGEIVASVIAVVGTVAAGARWILGVGRRVDQLERDRDECEKDVEALMSRQTAIERDTATRLASIDTNIVWIKERLIKKP